MLGSIIKKTMIKYASVISIGLILSFSSYLTISDINNLKEDMNEKTEIMVSQVNVAIQSEIQKRIDILTLFKELWLDVDDIDNLYSAARFETEIPSYFNVFTGFKAINWIDVNGTMRWIYPYDDNIGVLNESIVYLADGRVNLAYKTAHDTGEMGVMGVFELYQGGFGFITIIPLVYNSTLTGFLNGVFELGILFGEILRPEYGFIGIDQYSVEINFDNENIYQQGENFTQTDSYVMNKELTILDSFEILIALRPLAQIRMEVSIWNNSSILILGFTLATVVAILVQSLLKRNKQLHTSSLEKEELLQKLHLQQKMKSLGILAGGIAHDFNNLLAGIQGNVSLARMNLKDYDENSSKSKQDSLLEVDDDLQEIQSLINKSSKIINQITQFSRSQPSELELINPSASIENILKSFEKMIDRRIKTKINLIEEEIYLLGDNSRFNQILLNLWINARDAIGNNPGTINVKTQLIPKMVTPTTPKRIKNNPFNISNEKIFDPSWELEIEIIDTGAGIPKEIQDKIFDPFFTTKEKTEQGAGLGLTIVYSSIESMDGQIFVSSDIGKGTTFRLVFPILNRQYQKEVLNNEKNFEVDSTNFEIKDNIILLIEDELLIRNSIKKYLEKCGATIYTENMGSKGLKFYSNFNHRFDLVILDINLPGMNGIDVYKEIKKINSKQPILFITGYSIHGIPPQDEYDPGVLRKPFDLRLLAKKIHDLKKNKNISDSLP